MKNIINLCLDLETLSLQPDAAIIAIAAVPFNLGNSEQPFVIPWRDEQGSVHSLDCDSYVCTVNATTCALYGMHFDMDTVRWWSRSAEEAKLSLTATPPVHIHEALEGLIDYLQYLRSAVPGCELRIWTQGTDFDVPILKSALFRVLSMPDVPWHRTELRDARTYIHVVTEMLGVGKEKMYEFLSSHYPAGAPTWVKHSAESDARRTAINVSLCHRFLSQRFSDAASCG